MSSVVPVIVPADTLPDTSPTEEDIETTVTPPPVVVQVVDPNLPTKTTDKIIHYENTRFHYGFDMPGNVYFS